MSRWTPETACSPGCPGWFVNAETEAIERCDACARFASDRGAVRHVLELEMREVRKYRKISEDCLKALRVRAGMEGAGT